MKIKKIASFALTLLLTLVIGINAFAVPYENYVVTESGAYQEPQAYVPKDVIDSTDIGVENLEGKPLSSPQDMLLYEKNGYFIVSDTGNNRLIVFKEDMRTVHQIISTWDNNGKEDSFKSNNGLAAFYPENLLYVCDTSNRRIVVFEFDTETNLLNFKLTYEDPGLAVYFSSAAQEMEKGESDTVITPSPEPTVAPEGTPNPDSEEPEDEEIDTSTTTNQNTGSSIVYAPTKMVVDNAKRMFIVSKSCYLGLIELKSDGSFSKFFGATRTKQSLSSLLNRIFSAEAKKNLQQNLSTEYSNVTIDEEGFIYGTISLLNAKDLSSHFSSSSEIGAALRKLNAAGSDVMMRQGLVPPSGDYGDSLNRSSYSYIVDATVSKNKLTSILDSQKGRVFTYTSTGELLYVFGGLGERKNEETNKSTNIREEQVGYTEGTTLAPVAIELLSDDETIVILDSSGACLTVYKPTEYGLILREAVNAHEERRYDDAENAWNKVLGMSSNSAIAYKGVGKIYYMKAAEYLDSDKQRDTYLEAAEFFKMGYSQKDYGKAFYKYRDKVLEQIMPALMTIIIIVVAAILVFGWVKKFKYFVKTGGKRQ